MLLDDAKLLGVTFESFNEAGIKKAFRLKVMSVHPDVGGSSDEFMAAQNAQNNLLGALRDNISAAQVFNGIPCSYKGAKPPPKNNLDGITSLDLCLLISHISMLYYGDTLELTARNGRTFRYTMNDFKAGEVVPLLKDYIAWSCGSRNGLIEVLQPFEFSYTPKINVSLTLGNLDFGTHQFVMMFGGRAFPYTFEKAESSQSYVSVDMDFPVSHRYVGSTKKDIMLTIELDLFY